MFLQQKPLTIPYAKNNALHEKKNVWFSVKDNIFYPYNTCFKLLEWHWYPCNEKKYPFDFGTFEVHKKVF